MGECIEFASRSSLGTTAIQEGTREVYCNVKNDDDDSGVELLLEVAGATALTMADSAVDTRGSGI